MMLHHPKRRHINVAQDQPMSREQHLVGSLPTFCDQTWSELMRCDILMPADSIISFATWHVLPIT